MKDCSAVQDIICSQLAAAVEITLQFVECESAIVNKENQLLALRARAPAVLLALIARPVQKRRELSDVAQ